jgi:hypothetical protein
LESPVSLLRLLILLAILTAIFAMGLTVLALHHHATPPEAAQLLWVSEFSLLLAIWVGKDRIRRRLSLPFEFDALVFFLWPFVIPYYLYRSRGPRGLGYTAGIYVLDVASYVIAAVAQVSLSGKP